MVSQQCENLNLMEVDDYQKVALAINCSGCQFVLKIWYFKLPKLSCLLSGLSALRGLKTKDCSKSRWQCQGDIGEYCV